MAYFTHTKTTLVTKLTVLLMTLATLQVTAKTMAQVRLSVNEKQATMKTVLADIQRSTGYNFIMNSAYNDRIPKITIKMDNATITDILDACLKGSQFTYTIEDKLITIKEKLVTAPAQPSIAAEPRSRDLHGKVVNEKGQAVVGASVVVNGTAKGTYTDDQGNFLIKDVPDEAPVLVISYIGYERQKIAYKEDIAINLKVLPSELANVVVSNGYQAISKERIAGSVDYIGQDKLEKIVSPDIISRLQNTASGVFFTPSGEDLSTSNIFVRGLSTINSGTEPLIILDNFPYAGNISNINPNDVESITVLKDASAASIWGAKSGNGVIVITTKKGKYNSPLQVSLNTNVTLVNKPNLYYNPQWLDSKDFIDVEKMLFSNGFYDADLTSSNYAVVSPVVQALADARSGLISQADADAKINSYANLDNRAQQKKYLYNRPINQQYSLTFTGGGQNINYYISAGYDNNISSTKGNGFNRQTLHTLTNFTPLKNFQFSIGIDYNHMGSDAYGSFIGFGPGGGKSVYYPYAMLADVKGNHLTLPKDYAQSFKDTAGGGQLLDWNYRPLDEYNTGSYNNTQSNDILTNFSVKYTFLKNFAVSLVYQYEKMNTQNRVYYDGNSYYARNMVDQYTQGSTGSSLTYPIPIGGILYTSFGDLTSHNFRPVLSFTKSWKGLHEITAIAGAEINQVHKTTVSPNTAYGYSDSLLTFSNVNYSDVFYTFFDGIGYSSRIPSSQNYTDITNRFVSFYTNASYTYNSKYTISGSIKKDQSNLFGVNTNHRGIPLWSVGGKWKVSDETFYKSSFLPILALRATYGYCGNVNNTISALSTIIYTGTSYYTGLTEASTNTAANPELRWEKDGQINLGVDFSFKNNILSGTLEWYKKNAVDLIAPAPIDPTTGYSDVARNIASLQTNGVDVTINAKLIKTSFKWDVQLLASYVTSKVTNYLESYFNYSIFAQSGGQHIVPQKGVDPYVIYAYTFAGLDPANGDPQGMLNKVVSKDYYSLIYPKSLDELSKMGTGRPPYFGSISNTLSFKGITLSAMVAFRFGYYFRKSTINYTALAGGWLGHEDFLKRWQQPGDEKTTTVPSLTYPLNNYRDMFYQYATPNVLKGDNVRLQYISLGYDFKPIKMGGYTLKKLNAYMYANNIGILWRANKEHLDPDFPTSYPAPFSIAFGLRTTF